ncbi:hypothetical protein BJ508DRAFT_201027, partial [Ascobolus immersus RN42]
LVDFVLVCQYKYHTESTIGLLDEYLAGFHKYKDQEKSMEIGGHFNFIKIHLMSHFSDTVRQFGSLEQFSTEIGETLHKLPKEAYRRSNK